METGCKLHNDCFTCPFPDCVIDKTQYLAAETQRVRAKVMYNSGASTKEIATCLGKSIRTIQKYLEVKHENI